MVCQPGKVQLFVNTFPQKRKFFPDDSDGVAENHCPRFSSVSCIFLDAFSLILFKWEMLISCILSKMTEKTSSPEFLQRTFGKFGEKFILTIKNMNCPVDKLTF